MDNGYMSNNQYQAPQNDLAEDCRKIGSGVKTLVALSICLVAVAIAGVIVLAVLQLGNGGRLSRLENEMVRLADTSEDINDRINEIADNVYEISEAGCTGSGSSTTIDPGIYEDKPVIYLYPDDEVEKPVVYLYGEEPMMEAHVELTLSDPSRLCATWPAPEEKNGSFVWDVYAEKDGTLHGKDGYEYSYLFWEATDYGAHDFEQGFCVAGEDTGDFLRGKLAEIGLTPKEYNEFIVYWLPRMQSNAYNLISFEGLDPDDDYNRACALRVTDSEGEEADSMLRVMMVWQALDAPVEIEAQSFDGFERNGFTVVEWGGTEIK
ncbi:MAG: hypothetical protein K6E50_10425 [Lachnospiraceae bacterium]|nr:hypothetical protein [Lachnospiraceae bacterium]